MTQLVAMDSISCSYIFEVVVEQTPIFSSHYWNFFPWLVPPHMEIDSWLWDLDSYSHDLEGLADVLH